MLDPLSPAAAPRREDVLAHPDVQAALERVPGMQSLRLSQLSPDAIYLGGLTATETVDALRSGNLTATEVVQAAIDRAKAACHLGLIDHELFDQALEQAGELDRSGDFSAPLAGVPIAIKANVALAGAPSSYGSRVNAGQPDAEQSAPHVEDFLELGVIPIFMASTSEYGFNGAVEPEHGPPTRNPYNLQRTSGGSSGGSAVAVSAGVVPIAHGTDGGGSIRIPAALTGVIGMKPSRDRLTALDGAERLPVAVNTPGVLARTPADLSIAMHHLDRGDAASMEPIGEVAGSIEEALRIGYYVDPVEGHASPAVRAATEGMVETLRALGHSVEEIEPPHRQSFVDDFFSLYQLLAFALKRDLDEDPNRSSEHLETFTRGLADISTTQALWFFTTVPNRFNHGHARRYEQATNRFDLILNPTVTRTAPPVGSLNTGQPFDSMVDNLLSLVAYTPLQNVFGQPAISIPVGLAEDGLPVGVQFSAKTGEDALLLSLAHELLDP
ncbi:MAG: amidase family protein [Myxococcota bacterium]